MGRKKKLLIITDGSELMTDTAEKIAAVLKEPPFAAYSASTIKAPGFSATDLLPVHGFFIGCEKPGAFTSLYIEDLFAHISLTGRPCGIFAVGTKAAAYLAAFVRNCEAAAGKPLRVKGRAPDAAALRDWIHSILQQGENHE